MRKRLFCISRLPIFASYWPIALILVVAAVLRLGNITQPFIDDKAWREASDAMMAENFSHKSWNIFYPEVNWTGPGPGYQGREFQTITYLTAVLYLVVGQHDWVGRCVAVMFGLLGIFAHYQLIRRVWGQQRAIAAAALMALFPGAIMVERSFIPDPAMVALVGVSFWMWILYLQTDRPYYLILACVVGSWGNLTKIPGMIVGLPMTYAALSILNERRMLRFEKFVPMALVGLLSILPVIGYYLWARHLALLYPPHHFAGEGNWLWDYGLPQWAVQRYFVSRLWEILIRIWTLPGVVLLALGLLFPLFKKSGVEQERRKAPPSSSTSAPWIFHWWIAAGVVYYLIGALELLENPSNFHLLSPAVAALSGNAILILASFAAKQARQHDLRMAAVAILFVVAVGVCGWQTSRVYSAYARQSYELGLALREVSQPNDLVVTLGNAIGCPVAIYYSGRRGWLFPPFEEIQDWDRLPGDDNLIEIFEDLRAKGANWFGVVNERRDDIWKDHPKFAHYLERVCELRQMNQHAVIYHIRSS